MECYASYFNDKESIRPKVIFDRQASELLSLSGSKENKCGTVRRIA